MLDAASQDAVAVVRIARPPANSIELALATALERGPGLVDTVGIDSARAGRYGLPESARVPVVRRGGGADERVGGGAVARRLRGAVSWLRR